VPVEPPPTAWVFPPADSADGSDLVAVGADLEPGTVLAAYRNGLFPMPLRRRGPIGWWSPEARGVLDLDDLRITRSLRQSCSRYEVRIDTAFDEVLAACANPKRPHGWIDDRIRKAYVRLHELGWAHSVEAWTPDGQLAGGLYGISIGGFFAGESMFHRQRDASKVALVALVDILRTTSGVLLDVQWTTEHLSSLGARDIPRADYLQRLPDAIATPGPLQWG
jgi:leucyl/phenylalanyl-tRNA--protein transferase